MKILSNSAVKEFRDIYKKEYGIELSDTEARDKANKTLSFFKIIINEISKYEKVSSSSTKGGVLNDHENKGDRIRS